MISAAPCWRENVVAAAGVSFRMTQQELIELAQRAGFTPVRRTTGYDVLEVYESPLKKDEA